MKLLNYSQTPTLPSCCCWQSSWRWPWRGWGHCSPWPGRPRTDSRAWGHSWGHRRGRSCQGWPRTILKRINSFIDTFLVTSHCMNQYRRMYNWNIKTNVSEISIKTPNVKIYWNNMSAKYSMENKDLWYDDVIKWKPFPRHWPFKWRGALMFSLICAWLNGWINNRESGDLRRHPTHYDVTVMYLMEYHRASVRSWSLAEQECDASPWKGRASARERRRWCYSGLAASISTSSERTKDHFHSIVRWCCERTIVYKYSQQTSHRSPVRVRHGASFVWFRFRYFYC